MLFLTKDIAKKDIIPLSSVCHSKCTGQIGTLLSQICLWNMTTIINIYIIFNERNWNTLPLSLYPLHSKQNLLAQISLHTYTIKCMQLSEYPQSKFNLKTIVKIWKYVSNTPQTYMVLTLRRWKRLVNSMEPWDISSPSRLLTKSQAFHIISLKWSTGSRRSGVNSQFKVKFS